MSTLLAFDTSTERMSVALCKGASIWRHEAGGGAKASAMLIPAILALLDEADLRFEDLDAIAFGQGPGAFTGLRTACSVAQGLAYGARKPVLPVGTLMTIAEDARAGADAIRVWVLMDARMNEIYAAEFKFTDGAWRELDAPALRSVDALNAIFDRRPPEVVAGNAIDVFGDALALGHAQRLPAAWPNAWSMLPLADALWQRGGAVEAVHALPLYVRDKVAETIEERAASRAARAIQSP